MSIYLHTNNDRFFISYKEQKTEEKTDERILNILRDWLYYFSADLHREMKNVQESEIVSCLESFPGRAVEWKENYPDFIRPTYR